MRQSVFKFKQFSVEHARSAMKIGVDSVLLGSYVDFGAAQNILDIGSGCGLLTLMAAQKTSNAHVYGVEIDIDAFEESEANVANSPWKQRITIIQGDINTYDSKIKFDYIISNPPYFQDSTLSLDNKRTNARHNTTLGLSAFIKNVARLITPDGLCSFVLPSDLEETISLIIKDNKFYINDRLEVYPKEDKPHNRLIFSISKTKMKEGNASVVIRKSDNTYTKQYKNLTRMFYI